MGKKTQARPGHDGVQAQAGKATRKARRVAAKATKAKRKQLIPGSKKKVTQNISELEKLQGERATATAQRQARRKELEKTGALYKAAEKKEEKDAIEDFPVPPHRWNISVRKQILFCEVTLHKIPVQKIKCSMGEDRMHVDTLEHSKRWVLNTTYPHGIKVDPNGLAETNKSGILSIKLRITHMPEEVLKAEEKKQKSLAEVRSLRFRTNAAGEVVAGKKRKLENQLVEGAKAKEGKGSAAAQEGDASKKQKKRKVYVTDKDMALKLIDNIKEESEPKKEQRKTMLDHLTDMKAERKERRVEKRAKKQTLEQQAMKQITRSKKAKRDAEHRASVDSVVPLKKPTGRKVKFSA